MVTVWIVPLQGIALELLLWTDYIKNAELEMHALRAAEIKVMHHKGVGATETQVIVYSVIVLCCSKRLQKCL